MTRPKVLLVDDTKLVLELEREFLKFSDVDVVTASNGEEALELIRQDVPDLIFMDVNMPIMDGVACCNELKADPFLCAVPIVMLTTAGNDRDRDRALKAGCDDYLTKPIDRHAFLNMARRYTEVERRIPRVPCQVPVLLVQDGRALTAETADLGEGGVFISSPAAASKEVPLKIAFYLPTAGAALVETSARIAWLNQGTARPKPSLPAGFGVEFVGMEEKSLSAVRRFIEAGAQ